MNSSGETACELKGAISAGSHSDRSSTDCRVTAELQLQLLRPFGASKATRSPRSRCSLRWRLSKCEGSRMCLVTSLAQGESAQCRRAELASAASICERLHGPPSLNSSYQTAKPTFSPAEPPNTRFLLVFWCWHSRCMFENAFCFPERRAFLNYMAPRVEAQAGKRGKLLNPIVGSTVLSIVSSCSSAEPSRRVSDNFIQSKRQRTCNGCRKGIATAHPTRSRRNKRNSVLIRCG